MKRYIKIQGSKSIMTSDEMDFRECTDSLLNAYAEYCIQQGKIEYKDELIDMDDSFYTDDTGQLSDTADYILEKFPSATSFKFHDGHDIGSQFAITILDENNILGDVEVAVLKSNNRVRLTTRL